MSTVQAGRKSGTKKGKTGLRWLLGLVGMLVLTLLAAVVALALIGPAVGSVFSSIVSNCTNCGSASYGAPYLPPVDGELPQWSPVNGAAFPDTFFQHYGVNPFIDTEDDQLSTFALDVDTGSYAIARAYVNSGHLPPEDSVRVEEYVNAFDYGYDRPTGAAFAVQIDGGPTPFTLNDDYRTLRIGIQGAEVDPEARTDLVLTFVIDTSGSMDMENRLGAVQQALYALVEALRPTDQVAIVAFGDGAQVILPHTPAGERPALIYAIQSLRPEGSTNAEAGLRLGFEQAGRGFNPAALNRVLLLSDGVANTGLTGHRDLLALIGDELDRGITLSSFGFGMANYNDVLLEQLANRGDGVYGYLDTVLEAQSYFASQLPMALQTIAYDAKVQVTFNPETVSRYRLLGYENRALDDADFDDASVDAGEVGAGHSVTALYEIKLVEGASGELAEVALRWRDPAEGSQAEIRQTIGSADLAPSFEGTSDSFRLAVLVAEFAEQLRGSYWADGATLADVTQHLLTLGDTAMEDPEVREFIDLVTEAGRRLP